MAPNFTAGKPKAKLVGRLARLIRRHRLNYSEVERLGREARKETGAPAPGAARAEYRVLAPIQSQESGLTFPQPSSNQAPMSYSMAWGASS
jgi:hypothetical protein